MSGITEIKTPNAPAPLPVFSQAIKANGMVFCSGNIGLDKDTWTLVEGGIKAQTVTSPPCKPGLSLSSEI
jgi:enamine deaminase RidA (YjgF/YER057c/UK114 family)